MVLVLARLGVFAERGEARIAPAQERPQPFRPHQHLVGHAHGGVEFVGEPGVGLARARGAHRHVERERQHLGVGRLRAPHQIEADLVIVAPEAVELQPEHVGRAICAASSMVAPPAVLSTVRHARALRRLRHQHVGARPHQRRRAHGRDADRRVVAAAEQFDLDRRRRDHHAVARRDLDGVEGRPVMRDADIVAGAGVAIFEGEDAARSSAPCGAARRWSDNSL